jgi:hypothetical protein
LSAGRPVGSRDDRAKLDQSGRPDWFVAANAARGVVVRGSAAPRLGLLKLRR